MEDTREPLIRKFSYDEENQVDMPMSSNFKDGNTFEIDIDDNSSDFSEKSTSCLYKCFYPIIIILYYLLCC